MSAVNFANIKKTLYYFKRNGFIRTWYTLLERIQSKEEYTYVPVSEAALADQRRKAEDMHTTFSVVVPAYRTGEVFLRDLLDSLEAQSYPRWELILADATEDDSVVQRLAGWMDGRTESRIRYIKLPANEGISVNTNRALEYATGDYTGLLDHDDILTPDALYEMAAHIENAENAGTSPGMLYSDEDKCNGEGTVFYEPHYKEDFNRELLFSNNYICHFLVMKTPLIKELGFRKEYDGAQDYDLVLRATDRVLRELEGYREANASVIHVPKILYHWRCHDSSTAANPQSKLYAYEAGKKALQNLADDKGYPAVAEHTAHLGFYRLCYGAPIWKARPEIGLVGGRILEKGRMAGGRYGEDGTLFYKGLSGHFTGYMHRAVLRQDAWAVDIRCVMVRPELRERFEDVVGVPYVSRRIKAGDMGEVEIFDADTLPADADYLELSRRLAAATHEKGYGVLWDPCITLKI
ncbi:MAG: glycosyltransferase [Lachnospiraceae bacterium]|nr:glycosyltransferase [Lachnospiraceae bacterium]